MGEDGATRTFNPRETTGERPNATHDTPPQAKRRVFAPARQSPSTSQLAPFVSVEPDTTSEPATSPYVGMVAQPSTAETQKTASSTKKETSSARIGNVPRVAPARDTDTNAPDVEVRIMEPKGVHSYNLGVTTPLRHEEWSRLLEKHNLLVKYPNVPRYIQHGANAGIPRITCTYIPPNNPSVTVHSSTFKEITD